MLTSAVVTTLQDLRQLSSLSFLITITCILILDLWFTGECLLGYRRGQNRKICNNANAHLL